MDKQDIAAHSSDPRRGHQQRRQSTSCDDTATSGDDIPSKTRSQSKTGARTLCCPFPALVFPVNPRYRFIDEVLALFEGGALGARLHEEQQMATKSDGASNRAPLQLAGCPTRCNTATRLMRGLRGRSKDVLRGRPENTVRDAQVCVWVWAIQIHCVHQPASRSSTISDGGSALRALK